MEYITKKFEILAQCRDHLLPFTKKAYSLLPIGSNPRIIDLGCGIGVPTRFLAEQTQNEIWGVEPDKNTLEFLKSQIRYQPKATQMILLHGKFPKVLLDIHPKPVFDLIWAEGLLNVIGFEFGMRHMLNFLKASGFIVIHDEIPRIKEKMEFIRTIGLTLLDSFELTPDDWFKLYYNPLEKLILNAIQNGLDRVIFESELNEISEIKKIPNDAHSIFYIFRKEAQ